MMMKKASGEIKFGIVCVMIVIAIIVMFKTIGVKRVEGNEAMIEQHLFEGVLDTVKLSGTHFYWGWLSDMYNYNIGTQKITFDSPERNKDAEYGRIKVNVGEQGGQSAWISLSVNYRVGWEAGEDGLPVLSKAKLVSLHKDGVGKTYESVIIKRTIIDVVNQISRPKDVFNIYSGVGFGEFKKAIDDTLRNHPVFRNRGIYIENAVVYDVELNPAYEEQIELKKLAIQKTLREQEEAKAATARAERVKQEAQAEVEARTQKAEAAKQERVKEAEAEKIEQVLKAEGKRDSDLAKAEGVIAIGKAEAEVQELKREALYAGESGKRRAMVEVAAKRAELMKGMFNGTKIVPEKTVLVAGNAAGVMVNTDTKD